MTASRHSSVIFHDIAVVLGPSDKPHVGYHNGEAFWKVMTREGRIWHVPTRRVPRNLRWNRAMVSGFYRTKEPTS